MKKNLYLTLAVCTLFLAFGCQYDSLEEQYPGLSGCDTMHMTYTMHIKPILDANCIGCHDASLASAGVALHTYDKTVEAVQSGKLLNSIKHISGGSRNMPPGSKLSNCSILQTEAWIKRGYPVQ